MSSYLTRDNLITAACGVFIIGAAHAYGNRADRNNTAAANRLLEETFVNPHPNAHRINQLLDYLSRNSVYRSLVEPPLEAVGRYDDMSVTDFIVKIHNDRKERRQRAVNGKH